MSKYEMVFGVSFVGGGGTSETITREFENEEAANGEAKKIAATYGHPHAVWSLVRVNAVKQFWLCSTTSQYPELFPYQAQPGNRAAPIMLTKSQEQFLEDHSSLSFRNLLGKVAEAGMALAKKRDANHADGEK